MNDIPDNPKPVTSPEGFTSAKRLAAYFSAALVGAVLWPIQQNWRDKPRDNFPLSYYPMFSNKRDAVETFYYVVGKDAQGQRHYVKYQWIGDGGGNQVRRQLRRIINEGRAQELAHKVAKRVAARDNSPWTDVVSVEVCKGKYDVDAFFHNRKEAVSEKVTAFAQVERSVK